MAFFKLQSSNPAFNDKVLGKISRESALELDQAGVMTVNGTVNKVGFLVVLTCLSAVVSWQFAETNLGIAVATSSMLVNIALAFVIIFKKPWARVLAPVYALTEGLALGFISYQVNKTAPGIPVHAFEATFAILFGILGLYHFRVLQATPGFVKVVTLSTLAVMCIYLVDLVMMFLGHPMPMIHQGGTTGILFSCFVIFIASMNFVLDFAMIEKAAAAKAPKYMEWYAGFSVLLTIVWLYLEILRLLGRRD